MMDEKGKDRTAGPKPKRRRDAGLVKEFYDVADRIFDHGPGTDAETRELAKRRMRRMLRPRIDDADTAPSDDA